MKDALLRKFPMIARPDDCSTRTISKILKILVDPKTFKVGKISEDNQEIPKVSDEIIRKVSKY